MCFSTNFLKTGASKTGKDSFLGCSLRLFSHWALQFRPVPDWSPRPSPELVSFHIGNFVVCLLVGVHSTIQLLLVFTELACKPLIYKNKEEEEDALMFRASLHRCRTHSASPPYDCGVFLSLFFFFWVGGLGWGC